jgi:hypothetical protein
MPPFIEQKINTVLRKNRKFIEAFLPITYSFWTLTSNSKTIWTSQLFMILLSVHHMLATSQNKKKL